MKILNPSIILMLGYLVGQGSAFLLQLLLKFYSLSELLGVVVLLISYFSFAFQFSDLGNKSGLLFAALKKDVIVVESLHFSRGVVGFFTCMLLAIYTYIDVGGETEILPFLIALPVLGYLYGIIKLVYFEADNNYVAFAIVGSIQWLFFVLTTGICFFISYFVDEVSFQVSLTVVAVMVVLFSCFSVLYVKRQFASAKNNFSFDPSILQFVLPHVGGQMWARVLLLFVAKSLGLISLGMFGVVKYLQVFLSLFVSFLLRPKFKTFLEGSVEGVSLKLVAKLLHDSWFGIAVSLVGPLICFLYFDVDLDIFDFSDWPYLLIGIPFSLVGQVSRQINQIALPWKAMILLEQVSLGLNVAVFFYFYQTNLVLSILLGEVLQQLFLTVVMIVSVLSFGEKKLKKYEDIKSN